MTDDRSVARVRTRHFFISGAVGGLVGFVLMEVVSRFVPGANDALAGTSLVGMGLYFAGFGMAVGAALGMTEGFVRRNRFRLWYGLAVGLLLGALGGFAGGYSGQALFGLVPLRYADSAKSNLDLVIALDSSDSMGGQGFLGSLFGRGNDPRGLRRAAAKRLVGRLTSSDRVAIVDFDHVARVHLPLTSLADERARSRVESAIDEVDSEGGTHLGEGLAVSFAELQRASTSEERNRHVIFLTDGVGEYSPEVLDAGIAGEVTVHTVGLGDGVDAALLTAIATATGGSYYPVSDASDLSDVFESVFDEQLAMNAVTGGGERGELLTPGWLLLLLRTLSWGVMGLLIGMGQGLAYNTREDFRACALGGLAGGLAGGALFNPVSELAVLGSGLSARAVADVIVGATIGGSMRIAQTTLAESDKPKTTMLTILPEPPRDAGLRADGSGNARLDDRGAGNVGLRDFLRHGLKRSGESSARPGAAASGAGTTGRKVEEIFRGLTALGERDHYSFLGADRSWTLAQLQKRCREIYLERMKQKDDARMKLAGKIRQRLVTEEDRKELDELIEKRRETGRG